MKKKILIIIIALGIYFSTIVLFAEEPYNMGLIYEDPHTIPWLLEKKIVEVKEVLPDSVDHSANMPPVGNQGCNDCCAWATGYYYKTFQEWQEHGWDVTDPIHQYSPTFIYNQINGGVNYGSRFSDAFKLLADLGCSNLIDCPYNSSDYTTWPTEIAYENAIPFRCESWSYFSCSDSSGIQNLKQHLTNGNIAVIGIWAGWANFSNISNYNNIFCVADTVPGGGGGGHAVTIVGYNDNLSTNDGPGAFKMVNSWGTGWGDSGYWWMSYEAIKHPELSHRSVYYSTDIIGYTPTLLLRWKINHPTRGKIGLKAGVGSSEAPFWTKEFFNWIAPVYETHPFPSHNIVFDISEGVTYIDTTGTNVFLSCWDTHEDGQGGSVEYLSCEHQQWNSSSISGETPKPIPDNGDEIYVNLTFPCPQVIINPDTIGINNSTNVQINVSDYLGNPLSDVEIKISGWGLFPSLYDTTDVSGQCQIIVNPPYGEVLNVEGRKLTETETLFEENLYVTGGIDMTNPEISAAVPGFGTYDTLAIGWETVITGSSENSGFTIYAKGSGIDTSAFIDSTSGIINFIPQELGEITTALGKAGYNIYTKMFNIESALSVSGTWSTFNSPYEVKGDLKVPDGKALTIEPGVIVDFFGNYKFYTHGLFMAVGTVTDSIFFTTNTITNPSKWGGIRFVNADNASKLQYCHIEFSNSTGIYCEYSDPVIINNTVINNFGGGICCEYASPEIINNTITNNSAQYGGGIYNSKRSSHPIIIGNLIANNYASNAGGGICNYFASPTIINNTITNNLSNTGGGICDLGCYFSYNIINTILFGNTANNGTQLFSSSTISPHISYSDIQDKDGSGVVAQDVIWEDGNIDLDPLFVDSLNGDFHLQWGSPCIDIGHPDLDGDGITWLTDPDDQDPDGTRMDMGAYYFDQTVFNPIADFEVDITSGNVPLTVEFTDLSTIGSMGTSIDSWEWDFQNDGTIDSYEQNPQWTYYERGNYTVTLTVFDGYLEDTETKEDYISLLNSAPIIQNPLIDFSFYEDTSDSSIDLFSVFHDPDLLFGDSLSFTYSGNDSILVDITNGIVTLIPLPDWFGDENITFTAFDDSLLSISDDVLVTIINVNDPPEINFPANFTFYEDSLETYDFTQYVTDIDNSLNELSLTWSENDTINIVQDGWDIIFSSNVQNWNGMEEVTFFVDDNSDNIRISKNYKTREKLKYEFTDDIVSETIDVICLPVNDPPTIVLPDDFTFAEDSTLVEDFAVYIDDVDPDSLTLSVSGNIEVTIDIVGTIVTFGATENWNGTETLIFTVDDNQTRATASDSVDVIVTPVNDPPTIVLPDYFTFAEDSTLVEDFAVYIDDVDPDELTLSVTGNTEITVDIAGTIVTFGATENWNGTETLTFTVDDNYTRATASDSVDVIVTPVNDPPTIVLPDFFTFAEDSTLVEDFAPYIFDIDGDDLTLYVTGNDSITVDITDAIVTFGAVLNWNGTETLTFRVDDNQTRATAEDSVDVIVTPVNDPPVLISWIPEELEFTVTEDTTVVFSIEIEDIDSELSYSWLVNDEPQTEVTNSLNYEFTEPGDFNVEVISSDGEYQVGQTWLVHVLEGVEAGQIQIPAVTKLNQNYPNPFNPVTNIQFDIKENEIGTLSIYNIKGQRIISQQFEAGQYNFNWDATKQSSGVYLYKLQTDSFTEIKKMLLLK